jgi:hypothetical protein
VGFAVLTLVAGIDKEIFVLISRLGHQGLCAATVVAPSIAAVTDPAVDLDPVTRHLDPVGRHFDLDSAVAV